MKPGNNKYHFVIIFNPVAAQGTAIERLPYIKDFIFRKKISAEILLTTGPGSATELAFKNSGNRSRVIVAAGGDGTLNETANGMVKAVREKKARSLFSALPVGRGNDGACGLGLPPAMEDCLEGMLSWPERKLDLGFLRGGDYPQGRYFVNGIGIGFDTQVGLAAARMKRLKGAGAYIAGALSTLISLPFSPRVVIRNGPERLEMKACQISVMNGRRMGGMFFMAPESSVQDGLLDVCACDHAGRIKLVRTIMKYIKGTQKGLPWIHMFKSPKLNILALEGGLVCHADGETMCLDGKELEIECCPGVLTYLGPEPQA